MRIKDKVSEIRDKIAGLVRKNETVTKIEFIDKEEFVLDFYQRDQLLAKAELSVSAVLKDAQIVNLRNSIIRNRIKQECWDSMKVVGQSIKSFNIDPLTNRNFAVTNYPIRKTSTKEDELVSRIKTIRKTQLQISKDTAPKIQAVQRDVDGNEDEIATPDFKPILDDNSTTSLLFDAFDLTTAARRRMQTILLAELIIEIKADFNEKFQQLAKRKRDDIVKIEEKNERIMVIIQELGIQEPILHPILDDDEVPERVIEVADEEIKYPKFITLEERKRLEEKRVQDEIRIRAQKEDNWIERALYSMMNGKLEDRYIII